MTGQIFIFLVGRNVLSGKGAKIPMKSTGVFGPDKLHFGGCPAVYTAQRGAAVLQGDFPVEIAPLTTSLIPPGRLARLHACSLTLAARRASAAMQTAWQRDRWFVCWIYWKHRYEACIFRQQRVHAQTTR